MSVLSNTFQGSASVDLVQHGIQLLAATLSTVNFNITSQGAEADTIVALGLVDCLINFLKGMRTSFFSHAISDSGCYPEPMPAEVGLSVFPDPLKLLKRLQAMIPEAPSMYPSSEADILTIDCFAALLKASLCSDSFWKHFKEADVCSTLLRRLLLDEPRWQTRFRVAEWVKTLCRSYST